MPSTTPPTPATGPASGRPRPDDTSDTGCRTRITGLFGEMRHLLQTDPGYFWQRCLFWSFWIHLAFFCLGYGFREVMPPLGLIFLILYYRTSWKTSVLRTLPVLPLFACLWLMMLIGIVFSTDPLLSFLETGTALNKGLLLPFLGMECVRSLKDLKYLTLGCLVSFFWVGLDGIWQFATGHDFIMGYPMNCGRITSALGDYCVGNYMALVLVPAAGTWYICRQKLAPVTSAAVCLLLAIPGFFTLVGAQARSSYLAVLAAWFLWIFCRKSRYWPWQAGGGLAILTGAGLLLNVVTYRFSLEGIAEDGRWNLWYLAWEVFKTSPFFGAGTGTYNAAFRSLGLVPTKDAITIEHPHNLYLDMLYSTGLVGTTLGCIFLFGMLVWLARILLPRLKVRPERGQDSPTADIPGASPLYWQLAGLFALGYVTWLVNGLFGHEFFRMWWLGQAMLSLGVAIGAVCRGLEGERLLAAAAATATAEKPDRPGEPPTSATTEKPDTAGQARAADTTEKQG